MFRSWGELTSCATEVFHLFAERAPETAHTTASSSFTSGAPARSTAAAAVLLLSLSGVECAYYALFGHYPSPTLVQDCFLKQHSARQLAHAGDKKTRGEEKARDANAGALHASQQRVRLKTLPAPCITLDAFLRFVSLCAEEEGPGMVAAAPQCEKEDRENSGLADTLTISGGKGLPRSDAVRSTELQCWRQFESVAGAKGYATVEDLRAADVQRPFHDVDAVLMDPTSAHTHPHQRHTAAAAERSESAASASRQRALLHHVFWVMDHDHDGKVSFADARPYLLAAP